jgi:hypothetical protein
MAFAVRLERLWSNAERTDGDLAELREDVLALVQRVAALEAHVARNGGRAERRAAVKAALEGQPRRSNREIAKSVGVDEATVRRLRAAMPQHEARQ